MVWVLESFLEILISTKLYLDMAKYPVFWDGPDNHGPIDGF